MGWPYRNVTMAIGIDATKMASTAFRWGGFARVAPGHFWAGSIPASGIDPIASITGCGGVIASVLAQVRGFFRVRIPREKPSPWPYPGVSFCKRPCPASRQRRTDIAPYSSRYGAPISVKI